MLRLAQTAEAIAATTKKSQKVAILSGYFRSCTSEEAAVSAVFLSGRPFPAWEEVNLHAGGRLLWRIVSEVAGVTESALGVAYRQYGDLGSATKEVFVERTETKPSLTVLDVAKRFRSIAEARSVATRAALVRSLLSCATPVEAKYLVKIITGDLRIGLKESLVEESIAAAYGDPLSDVQRANMLLGDIGQTLRLAAEYRLGEARMRMFHPIGFMLASPVESTREAFEFFQHAQVEDKYDGIRAQAHVSDGEVRIFSRTLDEISSSFPELIDPLAAFSDDVVLDGEILAWEFGITGGGTNGRALPFSALQQRLGRIRPTAKMVSKVPVVYVVFDVLYSGSALVIDLPLRERVRLLDDMFRKASEQPGHRRKQRLARQGFENLQGTLQFEPMIASENSGTMGRAGFSAVIRAPALRADSAQHLARMFERARARGNEGLMIKDTESSYAPGRRGKSWLKLKRELATLDVVVTAVEPGHGKRARVLSDYTFAIRAPEAASNPDLPRIAQGDPLLNVGKAYTGLTDVEITRMTEWFMEHTVSDNRWVRQVEPRIVIEVAFNAVMRSDRHNSGYALRFPRIVRLRPDKLPEEADTIERVREIFEGQQIPKTA